MLSWQHGKHMHAYICLPLKDLSFTPSSLPFLPHLFPSSPLSVSSPPSFSFPFSAFFIFFNIYFLYQSGLRIKTSPFPLRWIETSTLSLPAFWTPPNPPLLWLSQHGVLSQGQKGEVGSDLWLREGRRERGRDQSNAFKLLIISIKALQDINPVRLLMCIGFWARPNYDWEEWLAI